MEGDKSRAERGVVSAVIWRDMKYLPHRYSIWFARSGEQDKVISDMNNFAENQKKMIVIKQKI